MIGRTEMESLTVRSALGGRMTRGFTMAGFLSRTELENLLAGAVRTTVIPGGAVGDHTVTGIRVGDALRSVLSLALSDHGAADVIAAIDDHGAHGHSITTVAPAGGGAALTEPAVAGAIESAGGGQVNPGAVDALAADQAHAATAVDVAHALAVADLTAEFSITGNDTINNAGGTVTTGRALIVVYEDLTP